MLKNFLLAKAAIYKDLQKIIGGERARVELVKKLDLKTGDKILDIGCGPAKVLEALPDYIEYTGFDDNKKYINDAQKQFKDRGKFFCQTIGKNSLINKFNQQEKFNYVFALGVLHHLTDRQSGNLLELAKTFLVDGGSFVTLDGCFTDNQSLIAKLMLHMDRGNYVRTEQGYVDLVKNYFTDIETSISNDTMAIPYTLVTIKCVN